jgi:hypothetical protein
MLNVVVLGVMFFYCYAECRHAESRGASSVSLYIELTLNKYC